MPAIEVVLIIGALVLAFGSAGLLAVRISNPLLRGLGWVGGGFAAGAASCGLLLSSNHIPSVIGVAVSALLSLVVFTLFHVAVLEMFEVKSLIPRFGVALVALQAVIYVFVQLGHLSITFRVFCSGLFVASQAWQTATLLFRQTDRESRVPARFTATILYVFGLLTTLRSLATALHLVSNGGIGHDLMAVTFMVYLAAALGIGFGLFWMATTILAAGLEHMASTDPLTRIYNRRVFLLWCERELERSRRSEGPFSILMIDLDRFKHINDRYGHSTGDEALCAAVEKMQDSVRGIDVLGRWGGEEFSVLLPHASADAAILVAERVRAGIARILLPARETRQDESVETVRVTASVGVATFQGHGDNVEAMIQRADGCLYRAKATGRNRVIAVTDINRVPSDFVELTAAPDFGRDPLDVALSALSRHPIQ
jgi:diguanylate cyclase (GGDEF)-like protein